METTLTNSLVCVVLLLYFTKHQQTTLVRVTESFVLRMTWHEKRTVRLKLSHEDVVEKMKFDSIPSQNYYVSKFCPMILIKKHMKNKFEKVKHIVRGHLLGKKHKT